MRGISKLGAMLKMNIISILIALLLTTNLSATCLTDTVPYNVKKRNWTLYYNSKHQLTEKVRKETFFRKGYAFYYDSLGNIESCGQTKFQRKHGRWTIYDNFQKKYVKYKYGLTREQIRNKQGKRQNIILTYGLHSFRHSYEELNLIYVPIAGCVVNCKILFYTTLHNFPVHLKMRIIYGKNWEDNIGEGTF
jgi:hypothetical protein